MNISNNKLKKIQRLSRRRLKKVNYDVVESGESGKGKSFIMDEFHQYTDSNPYIKK